MASDLISLGALQGTDPGLYEIATAGGWAGGDIVLVEGGSQFVLTADAISGETHPEQHVQYEYSIDWSVIGTYIAASVFTNGSYYLWTSDETVSKVYNGATCLMTPRTLGLQKIYVTDNGNMSDWTTFNLSLYINVQP